MFTSKRGLFSSEHGATTSWLAGITSAALLVASIALPAVALDDPTPEPTAAAEEAVVADEATVEEAPAEDAAPADEATVEEAPAEEVAAEEALIDVPLEDEVVDEPAPAVAEEPATPAEEPVSEEPAPIEEKATASSTDGDTPDINSPPVEETAVAAKNPTIKTDLADYPPGATVTITGKGWAQGEAVHLFIDDVGTKSWSHNSDPDPVAGVNGHFTYSFTLPNWFVADYTATATGAESGSTAETTFTDAPGDISLDFTAAAPFSYNHVDGGGAFDDRTIGRNADVVESLQGGDFACYDIVTYLTKVTVANTDSASNDAPQTIELDYSFLADTTGQSGVAHSDIVDVKVNKGTIVDLIPGENNLEDAHLDTGATAVATLISENLTEPLFTQKAELHGTVEVSGLDRADVIVVRIDVRLDCDPGSSPTGNLQADLSDARLVATKGEKLPRPQAISVGKQTIPFKQIGDILFPGINLQKEVSVDGGTTWFDADTEADAPAAAPGVAAQFRFTIQNTGTSVLSDVTLTDTVFGDLDAQGDCVFPRDIAAGASYSCTITEPLALLSSHTNTATATGSYGGTEVSDEDPAWVVRSTRDLTVTKTVVNPDGYSPLPTFTVDVVCKDGDTVVKNVSNLVITTSTPGVVEDVPTGAECTVVEDSLTDPTGWTWADPTYSPADGKRTVTEGGPNTVGVTNSISRNTRDLTVTKTVVNPDGYSPLPTFTVDVLCKDGDTVVKNVSNLVITTSTPGVVEDVPTGAECTVVEDPLTDPTGWTWADPTYSPADGKRTVTEGGPNTVEVTNTISPKPGSIEVLKIEEGSDPAVPLAGAVFNLWTAVEGVDGLEPGVVIGTETTDGTGMVSWTDLEWGSYFVQEFTAPTGYGLSDPAIQGPIEINAELDGEPVELTFANPRLPGSIEVLKIEEGSDPAVPLAGAVFNLWTAVEGVDGLEPGVVIGTETTDGTGMVSWTDLEWGSYFVQEFTAPTGYGLSDPAIQGPIEINAELDGEPVELTFANPRLPGSIEVLKIEEGSDPAVPLAGAVFNLWTAVEGVDGLEPGVVIGTETTDGTGMVSWTDLEWGSYFVQEFTAPTGYGLSDPAIQGPIEINAELDGEPVELTFANPRLPGSIEVLKIEEGSDPAVPLAGAVFNLWTAVEGVDGLEPGVVIGTETTDGTGMVSWTDLEWGSYFVQEFTAPTGYGLSDPAIQGPIEINAELDGEPVELTFANPRLPGSIEVLKIEEGSDPAVPLAGAVFNLWTAVEGVDGLEPGVVIGTETTDGTGMVSWTDLEWGSYFVQEFTAPTGYGLSDPAIQGPIEINAELDGEPVELTFANPRLPGSIEVLKIEEGSDPAVPLAGAVFNLWTAVEGVDGLEPGVVIGTETTDGTGMVSWTDLEWGSYFVQEFTAPTGYGLSDPAIQGPIEINAELDGEPVELTFANPRLPGSIEVLKIEEGSDPAVPLAGAVFNLWTAVEGVDGLEPGVVIGTETTDGTGMVSWTDLEWGSYFVQEFTAPTGYGLSDPAIQGPIEINAELDGEPVELTFANPRLPGSIEVLKIEEGTEAALAGAEFQLWADNDASGGFTEGDTVIDGTLKTTGEDGKAKWSDLAWGYYLVQEVTPPTGYALSDPAILAAVINAALDGGTVELTFANPRLPGAIEVLKLNDLEQPMGNVTFELFLDVNMDGLVDEGDTTLGQKTTIADGTATWSELVWADYLLQEVSWPTGYVPAGDLVQGPFTIGAQNLTETVTFVNSRIDIPKLDKTSDPSEGTAVESSDTINYTIEVKNDGALPLTGQTLVDVLPIGVTLDVASVNPAGDTATAGQITWTFDLDAYSAKTFTYTVTVTAEYGTETLVNTATWVERELSDTTEHPVLWPIMSLDKSADPAEGEDVSPGDTITYSVLVSNTGDGSFTGPMVDTLPVGFTADAASVTASGGVLSDDGGSITWTVTLAANSSTTFTYSGTVDETAIADLVNTVVLTTPQGPISDSTTHPIAPVAPIEEEVVGGTEDLAKTGADHTAPLVTAALLALLAGGLMVVFGRRRRYNA